MNNLEYIELSYTAKDNIEKTIKVFIYSDPAFIILSLENQGLLNNYTDEKYPASRFQTDYDSYSAYGFNIFITNYMPHVSYSPRSVEIEIKKNIFEKRKGKLNFSINYNKISFDELLTLCKMTYDKNTEDKYIINTLSNIKEMQINNKRNSISIIINFNTFK